MPPIPKPPTLAYGNQLAEAKRKRTQFLLQFLCAFFAYFPLMIAVTFAMLNFAMGFQSLFFGPLFSMFPGIAVGASYRGVLIGTFSAAALTLLLGVSLLVRALFP